MDDAKYYLWLLLTLGAGSRASVRLIRAAGSAEAVWNELSYELCETAKIKPAVINKLMTRRSLAEADDILAWCAQRDITVLTPNLPEYPKSLLCLMDFPMALFCKGKLPDFNSSFCCAVVGTRTMSDYGKRTAYDIGWGLGDGGAVLVSGLALGIDGMAMTGALAAGGTTVGVLGCGIDITYPKEHRALFERVTENGAVITEYPPGTPPAGSHFPMRNRIISGLCQACAVIEAGIGSGALITAKHAVFQGRMVFAVPGNVGEDNSEGCNRLLREGASVITEANDILSVFEFLYPHAIKRARRTPSGRDADADRLVRNVSEAALERGYRGRGLYGGREGKKSRNDAVPKARASGVTAAAPNPEQVDAADVANTRHSLPSPEEARNIAEQKTEKLRHIHIDMLGEKERNIYYSMKEGAPMLPDEIGNGAYTISEVLTAMTLLEIAGAVEAGAGGYYVRCLGDDELFTDEQS